MIGSTMPKFEDWGRVEYKASMKRLRALHQKRVSGEGDGRYSDKGDRRGTGNQVLEMGHERSPVMHWRGN